jgi:hypothetical protein
MFNLLRFSATRRADNVDAGLAVVRLQDDLLAVGRMAKEKFIQFVP